MLSTNNALPPPLKPGLQDQDLLPRSHGTSPRPGNLAQSPTAASSLRPLIQTLIISAYNLLQATSLLCFSFSALILPTLQAPSCPRQGEEAPQHTREQHSHPRSGARHRSIPEQPRRSLEGDRAAPRAAAKGGEDCTSPNLPAEILLLGELFTSRGRAALQGKVRPMLGMLCP